MNEETTCPFCGRVNEIHQDTHDPDKRPCTGSLSMCWGCHKVGVFVHGPDGLSVRRPAEDELDAIARNPRVREAARAMAESYTPAQALGLIRS